MVQDGANRPVHDESFQPTGLHDTSSERDGDQATSSERVAPIPFAVTPGPDLLGIPSTLAQSSNRGNMFQPSAGPSATSSAASSQGWTALQKGNFNFSSEGGGLLHTNNSRSDNSGTVKPLLPRPPLSPRSPSPRAGSFARRSAQQAANQHSSVLPKEARPATGNIVSSYYWSTRSTAPAGVLSPSSSPGARVSISQSDTHRPNSQLSPPPLSRNLRTQSREQPFASNQMNEQLSETFASGLGSLGDVLMSNRLSGSDPELASLTTPPRPERRASMSTKLAASGGAGCIPTPQVSTTPSRASRGLFERDAVLASVADFLQLVVPDEGGSFRERVEMLGKQTDYILMLITTAADDEQLLFSIQYANAAYTQATDIPVDQIVDRDFLCLPVQAPHGTTFVVDNVTRSLQTGSVLSIKADIRKASDAVLSTLLTLLPCYEQGIFTHSVALISWDSMLKMNHNSCVRALEQGVIDVLGERVEHEIVPTSCFSPTGRPANGALQSRNRRELSSVRPCTESPPMRPPTVPKLPAVDDEACSARPGPISARSTSATAMLTNSAGAAAAAATARRRGLTVAPKNSADPSSKGARNQPQLSPIKARDRPLSKQPSVINTLAISNNAPNALASGASKGVAWRNPCGLRAAPSWELSRPSQGWYARVTGASENIRLLERPRTASGPAAGTQLGAALPPETPLFMGKRTHGYFSVQRIADQGSGYVDAHAVQPVPWRAWFKTTSENKFFLLQQPNASSVQIGACVGDGAVLAVLGPAEDGFCRVRDCSTEPHAVGYVPSDQLWPRWYFWAFSDKANSGANDHSGAWAVFTSDMAVTLEKAWRASQNSVRLAADQQPVDLVQMQQRRTMKGKTRAHPISRSFDGRSSFERWAVWSGSRWQSLTSNNSTELGLRIDEHYLKGIEQMDVNFNGPRTIDFGHLTITMKCGHYMREHSAPLARFTKPGPRITDASSAAGHENAVKCPKSTFVLSDGGHGGPLAFCRSRRLALILACDSAGFSIRARDGALWDAPPLGQLASSAAAARRKLRTLGYSLNAHCGVQGALAMLDAVDDFEAKVRAVSREGGAALSVVYVAGNIIVINGEDYLLPSQGPQRTLLSVSHLNDSSLISLTSMRDRLLGANCSGCTVLLVDGHRTYLDAAQLASSASATSQIAAKVLQLGASSVEKKAAKKPTGAVVAYCATSQAAAWRAEGDTDRRGDVPAHEPQPQASAALPFTHALLEHIGDGSSSVVGVTRAAAAAVASADRGSAQLAVAEGFNEAALMLDFTGHTSRPQRPSKIGPFLLKKLSWLSVGFSLLEDDDRAEGAGFCFEWPSLPPEHMFGWASPFYAVTLPSGERAAAGIPVAAQSFAFAYPLAPESRRAVLWAAQQVLGGNMALRETLASFVENGGFVYVDSEFEIVGVNAVAARSAERGLPFGKPISFANTNVVRRLLRHEHRITGVVHEVSDEELKTLGAKHFAWIMPNEFLARGNDDGRQWPHGGFAYFYDNENSYLDCIFPIV